jgi:membrane protein DedA with SNARE-associated domain
MRFKTFFIASTLGTGVWSAVLAGAGYQLHQNVAGIADSIGPISNAVLVILAVAYGWRLLTHRKDVE